MNLSLSRIVVILAVVVAALAACQAPPEAATQKPELDLTLVHSNDTWGYTDPCG